MNTHPLRDRRILAVEDEYYLAMDLQRDLSAIGAVVLGPVPSVDQALALIAAEPNIDAAVLDINLGGELVYPVAEALAARCVPFVITSGYSDEDIVNHFPHAIRCEKPVSFQAVEAALLKTLMLDP